MAANTKARLFTMEDAPELTRLNKEFYGVTRDDGFWKWKYFDLPGSHCMSVMGDPQDLTGQVGALAIPMQYNGQEHMIKQAQDILIRKDGRQSRTFSLLERLAREAGREKDILLDFGFLIDITRKLTPHTLIVRRTTPTSARSQASSSYRAGT